MSNSSLTTIGNTTLTTTSAPRISSTFIPFTEYCKSTQWKVILGASLGSYAFCVILYFAIRFLKSRFTKSSTQNETTTTTTTNEQKVDFPTLLAKVQFRCQLMLNGCNFFGRCNIALNAVCVLCAFTVYVYMTYLFIEFENNTKDISYGVDNKNFTYTGKGGIRGCVSKHKVTAVYVNFGCNMFFLIFYITRLIATEAPINFWLSFETFADHMTIIPSIIMFASDHYMIYFQYLRLAGLQYVLNLCIYCNLIKSRNMIRLMGLLIQILSMWFISAGLFQLIEATGDFWKSKESDREIRHFDYFTCLYLLLVTMGTVGYGDYSPRTVLGRIFIMFFIILALGMFTSIIPEVSAILTDDKKYKRAHYTTMIGKKHVVVTGALTLTSMKSFINDFYHKDRDEHPYRVAFLCEDEPDIDVEALLKTKELVVSYYQGDVMDIHDLKRVCVDEADAVIILNNSQSNDPDNDDMNNIMRVVAIKDYCPDVAVLVVLAKYRSKTYLMNIPDWEPQKGDSALCINELKMGLLAQSCNAPGFSTLICNLLMPTSSISVELKNGSWEKEYYHGTQFEFYKVPFATYFEGKAFGEAAMFCLEHLDICLLAVETTEVTDKCTIKTVVINPGNMLTICTETMEAFVIAEDKKDADRLTYYEDLRLEESTVQSQSSPSTEVEIWDNGKDGSIKEEDDWENTLTNHTRTFNENHRRLKSKPILTAKPVTLTKLDSTGFFYWVKKQKFDSRCLNPGHKRNFQNHIVVCLLDKDRSGGTRGFCNFVMPLRAGVIAEEDLKTIVFLGDAAIVKKEWKALENFPKLYIVNTTPLNRAHLQNINIGACSACIILAPRVNQHSTKNPILMDKETILCTLNIKTMVSEETGNKLDDTIHILTELNTENAIAFIDQDDDPVVDDATMSQAFATGRTFFQGLLDNLVCTTFFNRAAIDFLRTMVTTVNSEAFEVSFNEQGFEFHGYREYENGQLNFRSQIELIAITDEPANSIFTMVSQRWKRFAIEMINIYEIVCIGISRLQKPDEDKNHRFVITYPSSDMLIEPTDKIYCLTPPLKEVQT